MASSSKLKRSYDVFLSFRGANVRNNFLGHLYSALVLQGIHTYKEDKELDKGYQISSSLIKAIQDSRMAIIVFSEDYASSSWCLDEAAEIMDCKQKRGLMVFPVFYKVDPGEVRTPRQKYRDALIKHESKLGEKSERVKGWKEALFNAGNLAGWHFTDGVEESKHIHKIVKEIAKHVDRTPLHVAKYPVGIDSQVVRLKSMLNLVSGDCVLMAGLWEKGGIGKTTLAKAVYNDIFRQFEGSSFMANVRETSSKEGLATLQAKLLSEILRNKKFAVSSVDAGKTLIKERLGNKRILLILDDVDDWQQLEALAGESEWFGKGSRIIVTTRDKHLLTVLGIYEHHVYEVKALDDSEARELFTKHASKQQNLIIGKDLVDAVLNYAGGLPLALAVLGSFLCGRSENEWKSTLEILSSFPDGSINKVLKISYDGLEENVREIFLHVACFFKGQKTEYIKKVLEGSDFKGVQIGLATLIDKSLITAEHLGLQMHDLIQLMGRDIVNQECRDDPRRRSRLWEYEDVINVLSYVDDTDNRDVKAIVLEPHNKLSIDADNFAKMRRLKLLILRNVGKSSQGRVRLPNSLKWYEWPGAPLPVFSSGPKELVGLDISRSSITVVAPKYFEEFKKLQYLKMSKCEKLVRTPDLSCTPNLKELHLAWCYNLVAIHESIAGHDKLEVLDLHGCSQLTKFPLLKSKNLRTLNLNGCTKFEKFPDIPHKLESLEELRLERTAIKKLPDSIENLTSLLEMTLRECKRLESLPCSIFKLPKLRRFSLRDCTNLIGLPIDDNFKFGPFKWNALSHSFSLDPRGCYLSVRGNPCCFPFSIFLELTGIKITDLPASLSKRFVLSCSNITNRYQLKGYSQLPPDSRILVGQVDGVDGFPFPIREFMCIGLTKNTMTDHWAEKTELQSDSAHRLAPVLLQRPFGSRRYFLYLLGFENTLSTGEEMPDWIVPVEEGSAISFMVSKDLYDRFLATVLCLVVCDKPGGEILVASHVNGKRVDHPVFAYLSDSDCIWVEYLTPHGPWGKVEFSEIDGGYMQCSSTVSSPARMKKWGIRILCKPLDENLKVELQDNKLRDLLYEVDSEAWSSVVAEDSSTETDLESIDSDVNSSSVGPEDSGSEIAEDETLDPVTHPVSAGEANPNKRRREEEYCTCIRDFYMLVRGVVTNIARAFLFLRGD